MIKIERIEDENRAAGAQIPAARLYSGVILTSEQMDAYLESVAASGCTASTMESYRRNLLLFYRFLPEDKTVYPDTLSNWQKELLAQGRSAKTVNVATTAVNGLLQYLKHKELQADRLQAEDTVKPELTRAEYLRLLSAAQLQGNERLYLLVKVFGAAGLSVGDLDCLTAEAVRAGKVALPSGTVRLPASLREELLHFMKTEGIHSGPVFLSKKGTLQGRTVITAMLKTLCRDAKVPEEKVNPRCLKKLYQTTWAGILDNFVLLAEQTYDRLLDKEQTAIGWDAG